MTTTATPHTVGDLERQRARYAPPAPPPTPPNPVRQATIDHLAAIPTPDLQAVVARRAELLAGLDECDIAAAVLEIRPGIEQAETATDEAAAFVPRAEALVEQARQALAGPDAEIAECQQRISDLDEALASSVGDVTTIKTLRVELAAYRETLRDLHARRTGPADQYEAAQRALRDARAAAAQATEAVDAERAKLTNPLPHAPEARFHYTARTALDRWSAGMAGEQVDPAEFVDARNLLAAVCQAAGFTTLDAAAAERRGRDAAWRELRRMPPHLRP